MKAFLSYSSKDKDFVRRLAADLKRAGIDTWLDEHELRVGEDLTSIESAIRGSDCLVVVLSSAATGSAWVEREITVAGTLGMRVLPVLLEDVPGPWPAGLPDLAHADFRRRQDHRRATHRLIAAIEGVPSRGRFLSAKEAAALVRADRNPTGELFGLSQQGVAILYSLANLRDWEFADTPDGTSRFWIVEFYAAGRIQPFAIMDGVIYDLPELHLWGSDPTPVPNHAMVFSCALNHLPGLSEEAARTLVEENRDATTPIDRRYVRFRPVPLTRHFVDSTVAVSAAIESVYGSAGFPGRSADLFILTRLECDKRNRELPTWVVAVFDPTLSESVLAVGVDAETGTIRNARMRSEILNANFMSMRFTEDGNIRLDMSNQWRAIKNHVWDIPESGEVAPAGLTAREAIAMAEELLRSTQDSRPWQLGFLSNTGVTSTALSPAMSSPAEGLMKRDGTAGQWVIELCGHSPTPVQDGDRHGHAYPFKQIVCTRAEGAVETSPHTSLVLTVPLSSTPLPTTFLDAYEAARTFAIQSAGVDFELMSVALRRSPPEAAWYFRFYDSENIIATVVVSIDGSRLIT